MTNQWYIIMHVGKVNVYLTKQKFAIQAVGQVEQFGELVDVEDTRMYFVRYYFILSINDISFFAV